MALIDGLKYLYNSIFLNNDLLISRLRKLGVAIGDDVTFYCPKEMTVDIQNPHLITIGDHVKITGPSTILTHDYSWGVIKGKTGEVFGNQKHVTIGNNVFIGWGATILCGTTIEDNVIVGARSVVSGRLEHDSVYAGIPAKKVCSLERYREKRASAQLDEAKDYVARFRRRFRRDPRAEEMREYFFLWATPDRLNDSYVFQMSLMGTYDKSEAILATPRQFNSFEQFLACCDNAEVE